MNTVTPFRTEQADPAPLMVMQLMDEMDDAVSAALFAFNLRADIEESLDWALLRERLASTPTLRPLAA